MPPARTNRKRLLPQQETITQMLRKQRRKSKPPPPPTPLPALPRLTLAQAFHGLPHRLLATRFAAAFRENLIECAGIAQADWITALLLKFFLSATAPRQSLHKLYAPQQIRQMVDPQRSRGLGEWLQNQLGSQECKTDDEDQQWCRLGLLAGGRHSGKGATAAAVAGSMGVVLLQVSHSRDPLAHFKQTRENTRSQAVVKEAGQPFARKMQLIRNLDEALRISSDPKALLAQLRRYAKRSRIPILCTITHLGLQHPLAGQLKCKVLALPRPDPKKFAPFLLAVYRLESNFKRYRRVIRQLWDGVGTQGLNQAAVVEQVQRVLDPSFNRGQLQQMGELLQILNLDLIKALTTIEHEWQAGVAAMSSRALNEKGTDLMIHGKRLAHQSYFSQLFYKHFKAEGSHSRSWAELVELELCCEVDRLAAAIPTVLQLEANQVDCVLDRLLSSCKLLYLSKDHFLQDQQLDIVGRLAAGLRTSVRDQFALKGWPKKRIFQLVDLIQSLLRRQVGTTLSQRRTTRSNSRNVKILSKNLSCGQPGAVGYRSQGWRGSLSL